MSLANLIMLLLGAIALLAGAAVLTAARASGEPAKRTRRLIAGTMSVALGLFLSIFALGLSGAFAASRPVTTGA